MRSIFLSSATVMSPFVLAEQARPGRMSGAGLFVGVYVFRSGHIAHVGQHIDAVDVVDLVQLVDFHDHNAVHLDQEIG